MLLVYDRPCSPGRSVAAAQADQKKNAASAVRASAEGLLAFASSTEPRYAHIGPEDRAVVAKEAEAALAWLNEKV